MSKIEKSNFFNYLLLGDDGVGKECLVSRIIDNVFLEYSYIPSRTDNEDKKLYTIYKDNRLIQINFTLYHHYVNSFRRVNYSIFRKAKCVFIVYDVCDEISFKNIKNYLNEAERYAIEDIPKIVIGCKCDDIGNRVIDLKDALELAKNFNVSYFEVNNKDPSLIEMEVYQNIINTSLNSLYERFEIYDEEPQKSTINLNKKKQQSKFKFWKN